MSANGDDHHSKSGQSKDQLQSRSVGFSGVDSEYIPKPKSDTHGSISSESSVSSKNNRSGMSQSRKSPARAVRAVPAYLAGDDNTVTVGYIVDEKSKHMDRHEINLLQELDLYAEKLLDAINADVEFDKAATNKLLVPRVDGTLNGTPLKSNNPSLNKTEHHEVQFHIAGELKNILPPEISLTTDQIERNVESQSSPDFNLPTSDKRHPSGTLKENIRRKFEHGEKDGKQLQVSAKWTLCKQEQRYKTKTPTFSLHGIATVGGEDVKSIVNFYIDNNALLNLKNLLVCD